MKKIYCLICLFLSMNYLLHAQNITGENIDVNEYIINLNIINIQSKFISGYTDVIFKPVENNVNNISLDLLKLEVDSIVCDICEISNFEYNDTILNINFSSYFNPEDELTLRVYYHGYPVVDPSGWGGFYFMNGYAFNMGVAFDDIPHSYGRVWFPCKDSFTDRAKFSCNITTLDTHTAVCAGVLVNVVTNPDSGLYDTKTWEWKMENEIPTYLASVAVGPYKFLTHTYNGIERDIPVDFYIYPTDSARTAQSFVNIDSVLAVYENLFGAYAWNRVGYVAVPFSSGAMEHVTNIAMGAGFINGTLNYEDLFYHELAHMWFGDQVTCSSAEDMWLNEGWATYCETIFREFLKSKENALAFRRSAHEKVLRLYHHEDGGFHPLFPISQEYTYSSTVYQKGASVVHSLRNYLGDDVFFPAISEYLKQNAYTSKSSYDLRDFLTSHTGVDLTDFFQDWVFTPGFVHYSIDSTKIIPNGENFDITVFIKQKLRGRNDFAKSNKVPVSFMKENFETVTKIIEFDGEYGEQTFSLNFNPIFSFCDYFEQVSDATIDETKFLTTLGTKTYANIYAKINVKNIDTLDTILLRITHNWVAPDPFVNQIPGLIIANNRFWTVEGNFPPSFSASAEFTYNNSATLSANSYLDNEFILNSLDSLVLLYRPNRSSDWSIENATNSKVLKKFTVEYLKAGEYCLGIYDWNIYADNKYDNLKDKVSVFPNPNNGKFEIHFEDEFSGQIKLFDLTGKLCWAVECENCKDPIMVENNFLQQGVYLMSFINSNGKIIINKKIIIQK